MKACLAAKRERAITTRFRSDDNLLGVGVGPKEVGGVPTDELALKFFVRTKRGKDEMGDEPMLPKTVTTEGEKVVTDVVQMAPLRARGSFTQRVRPGLGGCSGCVVVEGVTYTGTLGLGCAVTGPWPIARSF